MLNRFAIYMLLLVMTANGAKAQNLQFAEPERMGITVNSSSEEVNPMLSPDGQTLYFVRALYANNVGGAYAGMDIWVSNKDSLGNWSGATNKVGVLNNSDNNAVVGIRGDGEVLYLLNAYNNDKGLAFTKKRMTGWGRPETIEIPGILRNGFIGFYMNPTYDVLLISMQGNETYGQEDLYVSVLGSNGKWQEPENLGATINTSGYEISPFLSRDKKKLYFSSNGHGGYGDADIFVSERLYGSWTVWSKPRNLGKMINSTEFDAYLNIADDSTVVFASNREGGLSDIYQSKLIGVDKNPQLALKESLLQDARHLLAEIKGENIEKQYFIEFELNSDEISDQEKAELSRIVKSLNYERYSGINLTSFVSGNEASDLGKNRLQKVERFLKISGINENKIAVDFSNNITDDVTRSLFKGKNGVLIIVTNAVN